MISEMHNTAANATVTTEHCLFYLRSY